MCLSVEGTLTKAEGAALTSPQAAQVVVTWTDNSGTGDAKATDKTLLVVVDENKVSQYMTLMVQ
ncbi:MAG: hypothetical protein GY834_01300 [Bacteroidetes bacterium]|nr:hypothetical protein [Bacteroidota bacterium]